MVWTCPKDISARLEGSFREIFQLSQALEYFISPKSYHFSVFVLAGNGFSNARPVQKGTNPKGIIQFAGPSFASNA